MTMTWRFSSAPKIFSASSTATEADGDTAPLDVGLGADLFGHVESLLKGLVQASARVTVLERQLVGLLQLPQNLRLAQSPSNPCHKRHGTGAPDSAVQPER